VLFTAKRIDTGEKVQGLIFNVSHYGAIKTYMQTGEFAYRNGSVHGVEVDPSTVVYEGEKDLKEKLVNYGSSFTKFINIFEDIVTGKLSGDDLRHTSIEIVGYDFAKRHEQEKLLSKTQ